MDVLKLRSLECGIIITYNTFIIQYNTVMKHAQRRAARAVTEPQGTARTL